MATGSDSRELVGYRALVTGSTQGIGAAVAARLREAGATVLITARKPPDALASDDLFVAADVATAEGCAAVASAVVEQLGGIDIVVHVVGGSSAPGGGFAVLDDGEWHRALSQNLFPAVRLDRALLPKMLEQGSGVIGCASKAEGSSTNAGVHGIRDQCIARRIPNPLPYAVADSNEKDLRR